jgi:hypothetical protein
MFSSICPVRKEVGPEQRGQVTFVLGGDHAVPVGIGEDVVDHQRVAVDEDGLADRKAYGR